jgi:putative FmdB family regulatory protein
MPTYRYRCAKCGEDFEIWQSINDQALTRHNGTCRGKLVKVLSPAGIVLKGSGFYKTDSRSGGKKHSTKEPATVSEGSGGSDRSGSSEGAGGSGRSGASDGSGRDRSDRSGRAGGSDRSSRSDRSDTSGGSESTSSGDSASSSEAKGRSDTRDRAGSTT